VMARNFASVERVVMPHKWVRLVHDDEPAWSDDFSNVWTAVKWR